MPQNSASLCFRVRLFLLALATSIGLPYSAFRAGATGFSPNEIVDAIMHAMSE